MGCERSGVLRKTSVAIITKDRRREEDSKSTHDSLGIRWVLGEVAFQEVHGVIVGGAIELSSVPKIGPMRKGSLHGLDSLLRGARVWSPCKA